MDTLELSPGVGLGIYRLGDSLWNVIDILRARQSEVPKLEISWDPSNAHTSAVTVHAGPVALLFPPGRRQRLSHIHVSDLGKTTLTYEGKVLTSASQPLTRAGVAFALGPTYGDSAERLAYPGVSFQLANSGGRDDRVSSVSVTPRDDLPDTGLRQCTIKPGTGVTLDFQHPVEIHLGKTTAQDLLLDVGTPLRKYWKEDDRLDRVWGQRATPPAGEPVSEPIAVFWNYFQYGLDFLIVDDIVYKVIAYSNIPGSPQFQQYARCPWVLESNGGELDSTSTLASFRSQLSSTEDGGSGEADLVNGGGKKSKKKSKSLRNESTPDGVGSEAMILDRNVEGGLDGVVGLQRSQLVGFDGLVVEVDESSGGIAAVQVCRE